MKFLIPMVLLVVAFVVLAFVVPNIQRIQYEAMGPRCPEEGRVPPADVTRCRPLYMVGSTYNTDAPAVGACPGGWVPEQYESKTWRWVPETGLCVRKFPLPTPGPSPSWYGPRP